MNARSRRRRPGQGKPVRTSQRRPEKKTLLIVCEGRQTEYNYRDGLRREDAVARRFTVKLPKGKGGSRQQVVQRAINRKVNAREGFDEAWCVMDVESLGSEESRNDLKAAVQLARDNQVTLCLSNPAFEIWILAHFIRTSRPFRDCDAVITELNKHWSQEFHVDYAKNDLRIYARIADRTPVAAANARAVREQDHGSKNDMAECNSSTEMYKLVEYLTQLT
jgi:hypothetical protein